MGSPPPAFILQSPPPPIQVAAAFLLSASPLNRDALTARERLISILTSPADRPADCNLSWLACRRDVCAGHGWTPMEASLISHLCVRNYDELTAAQSTCTVLRR